MKWVLDTNIISYLLRGNAAVRGGFNAVRQATDTLFILSPVVDYEIRRYLLLKGASRNLAQYEALTAQWVEPAFDGAHWQQATVLWAERHRSGKPIEDADLLIAVTALRQDAALVTNNTSHFLGLGLRLEDWSLS
jgi:tRNA(fMet)-specific endonuclease VapC